MATNYYSAQLERGQEFQDYLAWRLCTEGIPLVNFQSRHAQLARGENALGVEIKFDDKFEQTGNLWIEVAEKTDAKNVAWIPSGICRDDHCWLYAIGNYREVFIFSIKRLQEIARHYPVRENDRHTSQGFLLPRRDAAELSDRAFFWPEGREAFR
jgi:hypothetical protein